MHQFLIFRFQIYLHVQRMYGSEGKIEITYQVHEKSAVKDIDYVATKTNTIVIESGQSSGILSIEVSHLLWGNFSKDLSKLS